MAARAYSTGRTPLRTLEAGDIARPFAPIPDLRPWLESRVTQLLDEADRLISMLDAFEADCDLEEGGDLETSLGGSAIRIPSGQVLDDVELDNDTEYGICDADALADPELSLGRFGFDGSGRRIAAEMVARIAK